MNEITQHYIQDLGDVQLYRANFEDALTRYHEQGKRYEQGVRVRPWPNQGQGYEYEATTAGTSGSRPFVFPRTLGATVTDGSVTWTARELSDASLETTLQSVAWFADDGITVTPGSLDGQSALAMVSGGKAERTYQVCCEGTMLDTTKRVIRFTVGITRQPIP